MENLVLLAGLPIIVGVALKALFWHRYEWKMVGIVTAIGIAIAAALWGIGRYGQTADTEILNGKVASKYRDTVSCEHSYECNCTSSESCSTDSQGRRSCTTSKSCQTCYEHNEDYDWIVATTVGQIKIRRVDRQGTNTPPRFSIVNINDAVAREHTFHNNVKAAPHSLFHDKGEVKVDLPIPEYPSNVYDYYHVDRAISVGVPGIELKAWSNDIANVLRDLGAAKKVNFVVVFVKTADERYAAALERQWLGGKKNDVIVVLGTPNYPEIEWVKIVSWTDQQLYKVQLRDAIMALKTVDREKIMATMVEETKRQFIKKNFADFDYLESEIRLPMWVIITSIILTLLSSIGGAMYVLGGNFSGNRFYSR